MVSSQLYYLDSDTTYEPSRPSPKQNLIDLYNLTGLALSVARTKPDGSKGIKLRKSYKSHIADLPGKHNNILTERDISPLVFRPEFENNGGGGEAGRTEIKPLEMGFLLDKLRFDRTPDTGIPDFNVSDLAVSDASAVKNGRQDGGGEDGENAKKRKKKGGSVAAEDESAKRRKMPPS